MSWVEGKKGKEEGPTTSSLVLLLQDCVNSTEGYQVILLPTGSIRFRERVVVSCHQIARSSTELDCCLSCFLQNIEMLVIVSSSS
jgi:hypothetical protein